MEIHRWIDKESKKRVRRRMGKGLVKEKVKVQIVRNRKKWRREDTVTR